MVSFFEWKEYIWCYYLSNGLIKGDNTMKNNIIWLIACILLLLIGGTVLFMFRDSTKDGMLNVNGVDVTNQNVAIRYNYAELPLTEVMKSLGMKVELLDNGTAEIEYEEKSYILDPQNVSLVEIKQNINLLLPPPGGKRFFKVFDKELILDSNTIKSVLHQMGLKIKIDINRDDLIVCIVERTD